MKKYFFMDGKDYKLVYSFVKITKQLIKFTIVGLCNAVISIGLYYLFLYLGCHYQVSNIISYLVSSLFGYTLTKIWVFEKATAKISTTIVKYYVVYGSSFVINIVTMYLWVDVVGISKVIAPFLTFCITIPYNFIFNKIWSFMEAN